MLHYDRIDVSERINNKSAFKECIICHYWYFLNKGFKFQPSFCNGCHGMLTMSFGTNNAAILKIHGVDYRCVVFGIKGRVIQTMEKNVLDNKGSL